MVLTRLLLTVGQVEFALRDLPSLTLHCLLLVALEPFTEALLKLQYSDSVRDVWEINQLSVVHAVLFILIFIQELYNEVSVVHLVLRLFKLFHVRVKDVGHIVYFLV